MITIDTLGELGWIKGLVILRLGFVEELHLEGLDNVLDLVFEGTFPSSKSLLTMS